MFHPKGISNFLPFLPSHTSSGLYLPGEGNTTNGTETGHHAAPISE